MPLTIHNYTFSLWIRTPALTLDHSSFFVDFQKTTFSWTVTFKLYRLSFELIWLFEVCFCILINFSFFILSELILHSNSKQLVSFSLFSPLYSSYNFLESLGHSPYLKSLQSQIYMELLFLNLHTQLGILKILYVFCYGLQLSVWTIQLLGHKKRTYVPLIFQSGILLSSMFRLHVMETDSHSLLNYQRTLSTK